MNGRVKGDGRRRGTSDRDGVRCRSSEHGACEKYNECVMCSEHASDGQS